MDHSKHQHMHQFKKNYKPETDIEKANSNVDSLSSINRSRINMVIEEKRLSKELKELWD